MVKLTPCVCGLLFECGVLALIIGPAKQFRNEQELDHERNSMNHFIKLI